MELLPRVDGMVWVWTAHSTRQRWRSGERGAHQWMGAGSSTIESVSDTFHGVERSVGRAPVLTYATQPVCERAASVEPAGSRSHVPLE